MHLGHICGILQQLWFLTATVASGSHFFQDLESEIVYPLVLPDAAPPGPERFDTQERDPNAGSSSREVRSISKGEEYESQELYHWETLGPQTLAFPGLRLKIPAFGNELHLILKRDSRFLSRKFVVENRLKGRKAYLDNSTVTSSSSAERSCYYSGAVLNYAGSIASFSTCGGLIFAVKVLYPSPRYPQ
ncbi:A disintegrin and metalloproteinase with thrombospondin motifs 19-like [Huso huso]|uniref:A disintegrin and metalloproteinase with thrombospondin motifs 19-like n=1 Tax=Huso huso TaxID=61971 RepID=A0ABR1A6L7_HUSHU